MERFTKSGAFKERCNGNIPYAEIICFVQKIEDVLEKYGIESVEELNERLGNAIVPRFKIGQEVWIINKNYLYKQDWFVEKHKIIGIEDKIDRKNKYVRWYTLIFDDTKYDNRYKFQEKDVYATKSEAGKRLEELKGE